MRLSAWSFENVKLICSQLAEVIVTTELCTHRDTCTLVIRLRTYHHHNPRCSVLYACVSLQRTETNKCVWQTSPAIYTNVTLTDPSYRCDVNRHLNDGITHQSLTSIGVKFNFHQSLTAAPVRRRTRGRRLVRSLRYETKAEFDVAVSPMFVGV